VSIEAAEFSDQGLRWEMEDRHVLLVEGEEVVGAVFDGHNGAWVAELAARLLPQLRQRSPAEILVTIHRQTLGLPGGACAVVFHLQGDQLEVANVGDAELALVSGDEVRLLTQRHRLDDPEEQARILARGGMIQGPYAIDPRTFHGLMPTRVLGDHELERIGIICEPHQWSGRFREGWLVAACDGLWDVISAQELPPLLRGSAEETARRLAEEALQVRGSTDNLTILVVHRT
jgi:serine/threonine protein phosphatase PrpC